MPCISPSAQPLFLLPTIWSAARWFGTTVQRLNFEENTLQEVQWYQMHSLLFVQKWWYSAGGGFGDFDTNKQHHVWGWVGLPACMDHLQWTLAPLINTNKLDFGTINSFSVKALCSLCSKSFLEMTQSGSKENQRTRRVPCPRLKGPVSSWYLALSINGVLTLVVP